MPPLLILLYNVQFSLSVFDLPHNHGVLSQDLSELTRLDFVSNDCYLDL